MNKITPQGLLGRFYEIQVEGMGRPVHFKAERLHGTTLIGCNEEHETYIIMPRKITRIRRAGVEYQMDLTRERKE